MSLIPERIVYTLEEAASHTAQSIGYLLEQGVAGTLEFFVLVPDHVQVFNVGIFDQRNSESPSLTSNALNNHQAPLPTTDIAVLILRPADCLRILRTGGFMQDAFYSAGRWGAQLSTIEKIAPENLPANKQSIDPQLQFPRYFAVYTNHASVGSRRQEVAIERTSLSLTAEKLCVSAAALNDHMRTSSLIASSQAIREEARSASVALRTNEKKKRPVSDLTRLIERVYLRMRDKGLQDKERIWTELINLARSESAPPPLIDQVEGGIRYEKSSGGEKTLTYRQFSERLDTITDNLK